MDVAEGRILDRGFAGATVSEIVEEAGVTKGAFFHHFDSKKRLAHALVERYARLDQRHLDAKMDVAERTSEDPLRQMLAFVRLFEEEMGELAGPSPGCLFASFCYQADLLDEETLAVARRQMVSWRERLAGKFRRIEAAHPPRRPVDPESLADLVTTIFEGAFVLSRTLEDPGLVADQLAHYRRYLELLFSAPEPRPSE